MGNAPGEVSDALLLRLGAVPAFDEQAMLRTEKWVSRAALTEMLFADAWGQPASLAASVVLSLE